MVVYLPQKDSWGRNYLSFWCNPYAWYCSTYLLSSFKGEKQYKRKKVSVGVLSVNTYAENKEKPYSHKGPETSRIQLWQFMFLNLQRKFSLWVLCQADWMHISSMSWVNPSTDESGNYKMGIKDCLKDSGCLAETKLFVSCPSVGVIWTQTHTLLLSPKSEDQPAINSKPGLLLSVKTAHCSLPGRVVKCL